MVEDAKLTSSINTSKIPSIFYRWRNVQWKLNWRVAEGLLYNQGCKKDSESSREAVRLNLCLWEGTQKRRSSLGSERFESYFGCPSPGVWHLGSWLRLVGGKVRLTGELLEALTLLVRSMCMLAYSWSRADWNCICHWLLSPSWLGTCPCPACSTVQLHIGVRVVMAEGRTWLWGRKVAQTCGGSGSHCGCLNRPRIRGSLGLWLGLDWHSPCPDLLIAGPCPTCAVTKFHDVERTAAAEEEFDCEEQRQFIPKVASEQGGNILHNQWKAITGFYKVSSSEAVWLLTVAGVNTAHAQTHSEGLYQPPLFPALLTSGVRVLLLRGIKIHSWREWSQLKHDPRGFCSSNLGPTTPVKWRWTLSRRECLTVSWFAGTCISRATSYQGDSCQLTLGKDVTCVKLDPTLPPKPVGTYNLDRE